MHLLKRILTAVVLIPIVLLLVLRAPVPVVALVAALVALLAVQELLKLAEAYGIRPLRWPTYIFVGLFFLLLSIKTGTRQASAFDRDLHLQRGIRGGHRAICLSHDCHAAGEPQQCVSGRDGFYVCFRLRCIAARISGAVARAMVGGISASVFAAAGLGGRHFCLLRGTFPGPSSHVAAHQSQENLGGRAASLLASLVVGMLLYNYALPISTALLNAHLIQQARRFLRVAEAAAGARAAALGGHQHRRAVGRSGGVVDQTWSGSQGFRNNSAGPRRHAGSHRCPALCRSGAMVLCGLARDAVRL